MNIQNFEDTLHIPYLGQVKGVELPVFSLFKGHHLKTIIYQNLLVVPERFTFDLNIHGPSREVSVRDRIIQISGRY